MNHVIEHIFEPLAMLCNVHRMLRPGGIFVAVTPNAESWGLRFFGRDWRGLEPPRHIHIFTRRALETAVRGAGFGDVYVYSTAARAWPMFSASIQIAERPGAAAGRPSVTALLKAFVMNYREANMNRVSRYDGEEIVVVARKIALMPGVPESKD